MVDNYHQLQRRHTAFADLQVVQDASGEGMHGMICKQLRALGCPIWLACLIDRCLIISPSLAETFIARQQTHHLKLKRAASSFGLVFPCSLLGLAGWPGKPGQAGLAMGPGLELQAGQPSHPSGVKLSALSCLSAIRLPRPPLRCYLLCAKLFLGQSSPTTLKSRTVRQLTGRCSPVTCPHLMVGRM